MLTTIAIVIFLVLILIPTLLIIQLLIISRRPQHSIVRSHPILGWLRYLLEKLGPEFRQYWFDDDRAGKPFSRYDFLGLVFSAKYRSDLIGFGSKRDFESSGYYIANAMFPLLTEQLEVNNKESVAAKKYVIESEGVFKRKEHIVSDQTTKWLYTDEEAIVVGSQRNQPWRLNGMFGASATSFGSIGENYITSTGNGAAKAGGSRRGRCYFGAFAIRNGCHSSNWSRHVWLSDDRGRVFT
jgi:glutamate synthase domain-containing protein 2